MRISILAAAIALLLPLTTTYAGQPVIENSGKKNVTPEDEFPFTKGTKEFSVGGAAFGSFDTRDGKGSTRPDTGYAIGELRFGVMVTDPMFSGFIRGNLELMIEGFGGGIFEGVGDKLFGGQLVIRYNFVQPHARFVPFFQIAGGGVWSDAAYRDQVQHLIGSNWSFNLESELGGRFMLSRNASINAGFEYRHISNADTASRNRGLNSLGGELSFSYYF